MSFASRPISKKSKRPKRKQRVKEDKGENKDLTSKEDFWPGHKEDRCEENWLREQNERFYLSLLSFGEK